MDYQPTSHNRNEYVYMVPAENSLNVTRIQKKNKKYKPFWLHIETEHDEEYKDGNIH